MAVFLPRTRQKNILDKRSTRGEKDRSSQGKSRLPDDVVQRLVGLLGSEVENISDLEDALEELKARVGQATFDERLARNSHGGAVDDHLPAAVPNDRLAGGQVVRRTSMHP